MLKFLIIYSPREECGEARRSRDRDRRTLTSRRWPRRRPAVLVGAALRRGGAWSRNENRACRPDSTAVRETVESLDCSVEEVGSHRSGGGNDARGHPPQAP